MYKMKSTAYNTTKNFKKKKYKTNVLRGKKVRKNKYKQTVHLKYLHNNNHKNCQK